MAKPKIVVIGSINMDLVVPVPRLPAAGETLPGGVLAEIPGGKGANQAVAAARLGGEVFMVGRVGHDAFGRTLRAGLAANGVDTRHVKTAPCASGVAVILSQTGGENSIVLSPGANACLTTADVDAARPLLRGADAVLLQLEVPIDVVVHAAAVCRDLGVRVILDPAPAVRRLPKSLSAVDIITPNESEARVLTGVRPGDPDAAARSLLRRGSRAVVLKRGARGLSYFAADGQRFAAPAFKVDVVDTTAAGDSTTAALAVALGEGRSIEEALRFANAAGGLACTVFGAQPSIPTRRQASALLKRA